MYMSLINHECFCGINQLQQSRDDSLQKRLLKCPIIFHKFIQVSWCVNHTNSGQITKEHYKKLVTYVNNCDSFSPV